MFRSIAKKSVQDQMVEVLINNASVMVAKGSSVWTAMALANQTATRLAPVTSQSRSAYCAMGVCFECMVEINGMPNQQACMTEVESGMRINLQQITVDSQAQLTANHLATEISDGAANE
ncbi:(2Fe-2S)-binding protein [Pelagibaculum spongiae]|uniref:Sarcosine oxidase n=1 Tax=Pelagibaculum spongiae TaxID=2080658 RepID=A0A2V1H6M2_9GAMM|nr:(2Fe-2S)-binding protein [Pelagibaculum spongiae]PVZ72415.1 sarcosine oxidase [Pelagibaculum spongiae]